MMYELPIWRLYLLRITYLVLAVGLGLMIWPLILAGPTGVEHMRGVVRALLGAIGLLALLGLRYPVQMLPLLLLELTWKVIWIVAIGLPLRAAGPLDAAHAATLGECTFGVVLCVAAIPWGHVLKRYVRAPGDPWRAAATPHAGAPVARTG